MVLWFFSAQAKSSITAHLKRAHGMTCPSVARMCDGSLGQTAGGSLFSSSAGLIMASELG